MSNLPMMTNEQYYNEFNGSEDYSEALFIRLNEVMDESFSFKSLQKSNSFTEFKHTKQVSNENMYKKGCVLVVCNLHKTEMTMDDFKEFGTKKYWDMMWFDTLDRWLDTI